MEKKNGKVNSFLQSIEDRIIALLLFRAQLANNVGIEGQKKVAYIEGSRERYYL